MKVMIQSLICLTMLCSAVTCRAQAPEMPAPQKEHEWLKKLAGEWTSESEIYMEPGKPPIKGTGTESAKMMGGFWLVAHGTGEMLDMKMQRVFTLGYDADKKRYTGSWVDSMTSHMWTYTGEVDKAGKTITLSTEGPCPMNGGKIMQFRETIELKSDNEKEFTSSIQQEDGKWQKMVVVKFTRKK